MVTFKANSALLRRARSMNDAERGGTKKNVFLIALLDDNEKGKKKSRAHKKASDALICPANILRCLKNENFFPPVLTSRCNCYVLQ